MFKDYGNVVLFEGNDLQSKAIRLFTKSRYVHAGIQVHRNVVVCVTPRGKTKRYLSEPGHWIDSYLILEHLEIDPIKRRKIRHNNNKLPDNYDQGIILRLALRHLLRKEPDLEDIARNGGFDCSSKPAYLYNIEGLQVIGGVNYSQVEPHHFLEGGNFKVVKEWKRGKRK